MRLNRIEDEGQLSEKQYQFFLKMYKEEIKGYNWENIDSELKINDPYFFENDEWIQETYLGSLSALVSDYLELSKFLKHNIYLEALDDILSEKQIFYSMHETAEICLGRFTPEDEYLNYPIIISSLHLTFELCCKCGKYLFPPKNSRKKPSYDDTISYTCNKCSIEVQNALTGKFSLIPYEYPKTIQ